MAERLNRAAWVVLFWLLVLIGFCAVNAAYGADPVVSPKAAKERFGHLAFFDRRLSVDGVESCSSCHNPDIRFGWSDGRKVAVGRIATAQTRTGFLGIRNTKSLIDCWRLENRPCNADGRAPSLNAQCLQAVTDPLVMGLPSIQVGVDRFNRDPIYRALAFRAWGSEAFGEANLREALVAFLVTIRSSDMPADRLAAGLPVAVPAAVERGWVVFKAHCAGCHVPEQGWRDFKYHNIGIASRSRSNDTGRGLISGSAADNFKFLTPGLSEVAKHAPYMHDGSLGTIEEVVGFFRYGGHFQLGGQTLRDPGIDPEVADISFSKEEGSDLVEFVKLGFQGERYPFRENPWVSKVPTGAP